jgi:hypothetical protein
VAETAWKAAMVQVGFVQVLPDERKSRDDGLRIDQGCVPGQVGGGWLALAKVGAVTDGTEAIVAGGAIGWDEETIRIEGDEAAGHVAGAGGAEAGLVQEEMQGAAVAGSHGLEAVGLAGGTDVVDGGGGGLAHGPGAGGLEAVCVEGDEIEVLGFEAQHLGGDMFEGVEEFAVAGQEQGNVVTAHST